MDAVTDADGKYAFGDIPPGDYAILPLAPDAPRYIVPNRRDVTKLDGTGLGQQNFTMRDGGQHDVAVYVFDADGAAIEGVRVRSTDYYGDITYVQTDADGLALFEDISSGYGLIWIPDDAPAGTVWTPRSISFLLETQAIIAGIAVAEAQ